MQKIIAIDASPNLTRNDVKIALCSIIAPWSWKKKENLIKLKRYFLDLYQCEDVIITQSGRYALYLLLSTIVEKEDEVLIQAFTCLVVPNAVMWSGARPIFVDIDKNTYNFDLNDFKKKITKKTKAVIVQHTFGIAAQIDEIRNICNQIGIFLIEDCAHSIGAKLHSKLVGTFGDAAIFSFNQDKVVSGVNGGLMIINNNFLLNKMKSKTEILKFPSYGSMFKSLLHPVVCWVALPLYNTLSIGKAILWLAWKLGILHKTISELEIKGENPEKVLLSIANPQAKLIIAGLHRLMHENKKRIDIAHKYFDQLRASEIIHPRFPDACEPIFLRYPIKVEDPNSLVSFARREEIILGKWYNSPVFPLDITSYQYYTHGSCPVAEAVSKKKIGRAHV